MNSKSELDIAEWIEKSIREFVKSPQNSLQNKSNDPAWGDPLIGFSRGDDPLYARFTAMIGDFYWQPETIFRLTFLQEAVDPNELSVHV